MRCHPKWNCAVWFIFVIKKNKLRLKFIVVYRKHLEVTWSLARQLVNGGNISKTTSQMYRYRRPLTTLTNNIERVNELIKKNWWIIVVWEHPLYFGWPLTVWLSCLWAYEKHGLLFKWWRSQERNFVMV